MKGKLVMPHSKTPEHDWLYEVEDAPIRDPVQLKEVLMQIVKRFKFSIVYCSSCGGEFHVDRDSGFSHCEDHAHLHNFDLD